MTGAKHIDSALARVLFAVRLKEDKTGAWGLVAARHKCAASSARNLAKDGYDVCILDALTYVGAESQTHWLPLIDDYQLDSLKLREKFAAQRAEQRQTKGCQMLDGMVTLTDEAVAAAAARLVEWCKFPCARGNFARQWLAVLGQPGVELWGGQDAWIAMELISRIWVEREAGVTMLLEKSHADIGVTLEGDGPEYIDSVARAIPGEVKVVTKERGYDDAQVRLKEGHTLDELMHGKKPTKDEEGSKGEKYLQLVLQEVGDKPLAPDVIVAELKSLVEGEEMYATGGYPLEVLDAPPTSVPSMEDHTSGALYVLVQDPSGGEAQPWFVRGDKWVRGLPNRARGGLRGQSHVDRRLLRRCALNNMRGTAISLAAADDGALARMMRAVSTAQPEQLPRLAELQWGNGGIRNAHNQALLKAATKLHIESMLVRGNYVTEAKEHFGVIVDGRTLTVCTAACSRYPCDFAFFTDRGHSRAAAPLPFGSPDMVLVCFSGDALKTKAWDKAWSAGGMQVADKAAADKATGATRRSNPLSEVFFVVPLHADVWAGFDGPPGIWPKQIAAYVKHFAEFEGVPTPLELSKQHRASNKLGEVAADLVRAGMCSLEELPKMVALCSLPSRFKERVAAIKAARPRAQAAALVRLATMLEAQGRKAVQEAGKSGLVLERSSAKSGFVGVVKPKGVRPGWSFRLPSTRKWHLEPGTFATPEEAAVARAFAIKAHKPKPKPPAKGIKRSAPAAEGKTRPSKLSRRAAKEQGAT